MNGLDAYFSEYSMNDLLGKADSRQYSAESQKIAKIPVLYFRRKINVKPVLEPYIYQFKKTPVSGRDNDEKGQIFVKNEKSFVF